MVSPFLGLWGLFAHPLDLLDMEVSCAAIITKYAMMEDPYRLSHMTSHTATLQHLRCPIMIGEVTCEM